MRAYRFPEFDEPLYPCKDRDVVVIGGGNTAMDAVRSALRLGAKTASILYRRTEAEMPARVEEVHHAKDEGIRFEMLVNPVEFRGDEKGNLKSVICTRMELGEPDDSGRRSPVTIKGSEFETPCSVAIIAAGTSANPLIQSSTPGLQVTKRGYIAANDDTLATSKTGVFAGGDIVTGGATVILAMGAGRKAAKSINQYLLNLNGAAVETATATAD
jgi:glutamate synthase (NADPH/NADH) small chain